MRDDSANISIDFLVGVTIFIVCFIWVATMIPGMMIGLQANTVDYDAVAYRTGVILIEDPGLPASYPSWETRTNLQKDEIERLGLAVSKDTPNILSEAKVNRFFCTTLFSYPDDYQERAIFGEYPYHFNISLLDVVENETHSLGETIPDGFGYIRRSAKIRGTSNATVNESYIQQHNFNSTYPVTTHQFSVHLNSTYLLTEVKDPLFQINPASEKIMINITDIRSTINVLSPLAIPPTVTIRLANITAYKEFVTPGGERELSYTRAFDEPWVDGIHYKDTNSTAAGYQIVPLVNDNVAIIITPDFYNTLNAQYTNVYFNFTFELNEPSIFLNNTWCSPFVYNYHPDNVTQPQLRDAVVEVAVW